MPRLRKQTSLKANTIFDRTLLPLTMWFLGMYLLTQSKNLVSGLDLARQLGVRPDTAALMRHKLMSVMADTEAARKLDGCFEMDDAALGGERHELDGEKRGREGANTPSFVVAVATSDEGRPKRLLLHVVKTHHGDEIKKLAQAHLAVTARVVSDRLGCWRAVTRTGCTHEPIVAAMTGWSEKMPAFRWGNTVLGNLKTAMSARWSAPPSGTFSATSPSSSSASADASTCRHRSTISSSLQPWRHPGPAIS